MSFANKFNTKRVQTMHKDLAEKFNNRESRAQLFQDFMDCEGNLDAMKVLHKRRMISSTRARTQMEAKFEWEILERFNDQDHVNKVITLAKAENRALPDPLAPTDGSKTRYLIPWSVSFTSDTTFEESTEIGAEKELSDPDVLRILTGPGGLLAGPDITKTMLPGLHVTVLPIACSSLGPIPTDSVPLRIECWPVMRSRAQLMYRRGTVQVLSWASTLQAVCVRGARRVCYEAGHAEPREPCIAAHARRCEG